jgi:hypothetical protein
MPNLPMNGWRMIAERLKGMAEWSQRTRRVTVSTNVVQGRSWLASCGPYGTSVKCLLYPEAAGHPSGPVDHTRRYAGSDSRVPIFVVLGSITGMMI